jgi:hypothetical protein
MSKIGRPRKSEEEKAKWDDQLECAACGGTYLRANQTRHKKTKIHQLAERLINDKRVHNSKKVTQKKTTNKDTEDDYSTKISKKELKKRLIDDTYVPPKRELSIPQEYHDYVNKRYGRQIRFKEEAIEYFNDPRITPKEKYETIDYIATYNS